MNTKVVEVVLRCVVVSARGLFVVVVVAAVAVVVLRLALCVAVAELVFHLALRLAVAVVVVVLRLVTERAMPSHRHLRRKRAMGPPLGRGGEYLSAGDGGGGGGARRRGTLFKPKSQARMN